MLGNLPGTGETLLVRREWSSPVPGRLLATGNHSPYNGNIPIPLLRLARSCG